MINNLLRRGNKVNRLCSLSRRFFRPTQNLNKQFQVFVDDRPVTVDSSYTIFQACTEAGVTIPRFCYHERLAVAGNCRMWLVEVEQSPKPIAACAMNVMPDMKINTQSETTRIARGGVMEFLLANHPLDCPICDQGGECDLQDISQVYGFREGRYMEYKRAVEDKYLGPLIKTTMNRCIHCTRCIRFTEQIAGEHTLGTTGRGGHTEIGTYIETLVTNELSANAVDLWPVGALTHLPYAFIARPWELKTTYSTDVMDGLGSNIEINSRGGEVMRVLPRVNEEVNQEWISDKSRHAFDGLKKQRLSFPLYRTKEGEIKELRWEEAMLMLRDKFEHVSGKDIAGLVGRLVDVETTWAFRDLLLRLGCERIETNSLAPKINVNLRSEYLFNSQIRGIDDTDYILFVGCNPRTESPVLNARIRKLVEEEGLEVAVLGYPPDLNYDYDHVGNSTHTLDEIAHGNHPISDKLLESEMPMIIVSSHALSRDDGEGILNNLKVLAENTPVVNKEEKWNGLNILHNEASRVGAWDLGIPQYTGKESLKDAKIVYLLGCDEFREEDIPEDAFVIYQGHHGDEGAYYADLILPGSGYTEKQASYANTEGRVQVGRKVVTAPALAREDWMIIRALSEELGSALPYDTIEELRERIAELAPHLIKYDGLEASGFEDLVLANKRGGYDMNGTPFDDPIDNFYMTDSISRNSSVMANCTKELNPKKYKNFKAPGIDFAGR
jgi:NADH dehydrogenase (ubiquinone) Fe-S protein 1